MIFGGDIYPTDRNDKSPLCSIHTIPFDQVVVFFQTGRMLLEHRNHIGTKGTPADACGDSVIQFDGSYIFFKIADALSYS